MSWKPDKKEEEFVRLVASMCLDCMMGKGTDDRETFVANLRMIADGIEELPEGRGVRDDGLVNGPADKQARESG